MSGGRRVSRGEAAMEELLGKLEPGSDRYRVLAAARDFKAAWVELGERLTEARESNVWRDWGYETFEAYCRTELRVKPDTANKLTRSFSFLRDHTPEALEQRETRELPPLDVVDLLSRARERSTVSEAQLRNISEEVFTGEPPTRGDVIKRFREVDPMAFKTPTSPKSEGGGEGDLRKALLLGERLQSLVGGLELTRPAREGLKQLVRELQEMFGSAGQSGTLRVEGAAGRVARARPVKKKRAAHVR
jgi:hypothetical protein